MFSSSTSSMRFGYVLGFLACAGLIAYALYVQYQLFIEPCPLCILQRVVFIAMGVVFLLGALHAPRYGGRRAYAAVLSVLALIGIGIAWRHLWLQSLPADQVPACGPGLSYMIDAFPLGETIKMVFTGSGECAEINWRFLGLAMPAWSVVWYVLLGAWAWWAVRRPRIGSLGRTHR